MPKARLGSIYPGSKGFQADLSLPTA